MARIIVFLVIIGFSVVKSLITAAQEKAKTEQLRQAQIGRANRQRTAENEIDSYLQDVDDSPRRPPQQTETLKARERRERRKRQAELKKRNQEKQRLQQRTSGKAQTLGSGVGQHVDQYINRHVDEYLDHDVDEYVATTIVDQVDDNFGKRSLRPAPTTTAKKSRAAESVIALLRDPAGIRDAILVNEILARPRALDRQRTP